MVLPRLLTEANLERAGQDTITSNRLSGRLSNRSSVQLLRSVDNAIEQQKMALRRINHRIFAYNVTMTLVIGFYCVFQQFSFDWIGNNKLAEDIDEIIFETILLLNAFILAYSAMHIRKTIKSLNNAFPNESFIRVHLANSFVYAILYFVLGIMTIMQNKVLD